MIAFVQVNLIKLSSANLKLEAIVKLFFSSTQVQLERFLRITVYLWKFVFRSTVVAKLLENLKIHLLKYVPARSQKKGLFILDGDQRSRYYKYQIILQFEKDLNKKLQF